MAKAADAARMEYNTSATASEPRMRHSPSPSLSPMPHSQKRRRTDDDDDQYHDGYGYDDSADGNSTFDDQYYPIDSPIRSPELDAVDNKDGGTDGIDDADLTVSFYFCFFLCRLCCPAINIELTNVVTITYPSGHGRRRSHQRDFEGPG